MLTLRILRVQEGIVLYKQKLCYSVKYEFYLNISYGYIGFQSFLCFGIGFLFSAQNSMVGCICGKQTLWFVSYTFSYILKSKPVQKCLLVLNVEIFHEISFLSKWFIFNVAYCLNIERMNFNMLKPSTLS